MELFVFKVQTLVSSQLLRASTQKIFHTNSIWLLSSCWAWCLTKQSVDGSLEHEPMAYQYLLGRGVLAFLLLNWLSFCSRWRNSFKLLKKDFSPACSSWIASWVSWLVLKPSFINNWHWFPGACSWSCQNFS